MLPHGFHEPVLAALEKVLSSALAARRTDDAIRIARCLTGLATQAGYHDLQGEKPGSLGRAADIGAEGLARARADLAARGDAPWTVEELEALSEEQGEAFTREHASFGTPGVALSPAAWYRVETDCGHQTLLGVASTVEDHHRRLANWYGKDPFAGRQGTVRVVHEASDLEAEGAPFFWVGGFQSGDVTVGRLACGTIEGFGHLLTHELTHRFDGAIYPGEPSWLAEGKAVWTGAAYGHSTDESFVENHASFGTVEAAFIKGYGSSDKLEKLVSGTLEDYRDNYVAGYALYLYLATWKENDRPLYRERLQAFMESGRTSKLGPKERFLAHFCDGKDGRPAKLEEFATRFGEYISGFYWKTPKPWTQAYTQSVPGGGSDGWVYDEPTWTWARERSEPFFGLEQARRAGELLLELDKKSEGARALVWALASDGPSPAVEEEPRVPDAPAQRSVGALTRDFIPARERTGRATALLPQDERALAFTTSATDLKAGARTKRARPCAPSVIGSLLARRRSSAGRPATPRTRREHPGPRIRPRHLGYAGWDERASRPRSAARRDWYADESGDVHVGREAAHGDHALRSCLTSGTLSSSERPAPARA